ncbi:MAG: DUF2807 domain-containing protein [Fluviicola sp.]|nr:DUF2807 domain-containing protein [Fluviicola sp.]
MKQLGLFFGICLLVISCKKPENRACWKFLGDIKSKEIPVGNFNQLFLNPHIEYELIQDSTNKLVVIGGENVINFIEWTVVDGMLEIKNKNKCNFLRNQKKVIKVEIHCSDIIYIRFEGTEPLSTKSQLNFPYFTLLIRDGAGPVNLNLNSTVINADISHGWGDYTLTGTAQIASISARSNGFCDAYGLIVTDSIYVSSETAGSVKVNSNGLPLHGYLKSLGNILYKGNPSGIHILDTGSGSVVNDN